MKTSAALLAVLIAVTALPLFAQQQQLSETIEVRVLNVDVVVRDRSGKPVTGLTKDDFELWDNGKKQEVTNAYEVRNDGPKKGVVAAVDTQTMAPLPPAPANPAPPEARDRKIVIFIDNYSMPPLRRNQVLTSVDKFIDQKMRPEDQAMIVVWQHTPKITQQFTSDRKVLHAAIAALSTTSNGGTLAQDIEQIKRQTNDLIEAAQTGHMTWNDAYRNAQLNVSSYAEQVTFTATRLLKNLGDTAAALSGIEGRKAIVLAGAHMPEKPGVELYTYVYNRFQQHIRTLELSSDSIMGRNNQVKFSIRDAAERAASSGVTFYVIDAADLRDGIDAEYNGSYLADASERAMTYNNTAIAFNNLARITGGVAMLAENFDAAFDALASDFDSYYSLGYRPTDDVPGKTHRIEVKTKNPAYRARARETYKAKSVEEVLNDRVCANIVTDVHGDWPIAVKTGEPRKDGNRFRVPVLVALAPNLTLLPRDGKLTGGFTIYIVVGTNDGRRSAISKIPQPVEITPDKEQQLRSKPLTFGMLVTMTPGDNFVSVAAVDQVTSSTGFARTAVKLQ